MGSRIKLAHTRAIIAAIHDGRLATVATKTDPVFGLEIPTECPGTPSNLLVPRSAWADGSLYDHAAASLAQEFQRNFAVYADQASEEVRHAGPRV